MSTMPLQTLLGAVRHTLWRAQFVVATRRALWASSALELLAAIGSLSGWAVHHAAVLVAVGVLWVLLLSWAAWQRPGAAACALWADRHLGGASAFTTWLETAGSPSALHSAPAVLWLRQWTEQRVPESLRLLGERRTRNHLGRPLLVALVSAALAALVATLNPPALTAAGVASAPPPPAAASPAGAGETQTGLAQAPETTPLLGELSTALRSAEAREAPARGGAGQTPAAGAGKPGVDQTPASAPGAAASAVDQARSGPAAAGTPAAAPLTAGADNSSGPSAGRDAGDSRGRHADVGDSRPFQAAIPVPRSVLREPAAAGQQADMERLATFEPDLSMPGRASMRAWSDAAAATPPPATDDTRLTPTQSSYVQAWMKASARNR